MEIVRTAAFAKSLKKLGATTGEIAALEDAIAADPAIGDVIQGLDGVRKVRFAMKGRGKSGGGRAVYIVLWTADTAYMLLAYDKSVQTDLSQDQRKAIKVIIEELS